ncbi:MAG: hypothetical protein L6Q99_19215 [Planctomycetes bacterium]|nr:hypothetical protein [Planctomycetota bacterium]
MEEIGSAREGLSALESPFCKHLRSKKWYFRTGPPRVARDLLDASNHTWCGKTCEALGVDGDVADTEGCVRGRGCFEPYFEGPGPSA